MASRQKRSTDAIDILDRRFYQGSPKRLAEAEQAVAHAVIAQEIYRLRTKAGLTQAQLAARVGTSVSAISRLEDADYDGHSLNVLVRVMTALNRRMDWRTVPLPRGARRATRPGTRRIRPGTRPTIRP